MASPAELPNPLVDVLSDDVLRSMCTYLKGAELIRVGRGSAALYSRTQGCAPLWRSLCDAFLGRSLLRLHEVIAVPLQQEEVTGTAELPAHDAKFYKQLFRAAWHCASFRYHHDMRKACMDTVYSSSRLADGQEKEDLTQFILSVSGHTSEAIGDLVICLGGMSLPPDPSPDLRVSIVDLSRRCLTKPSLAADSARPLDRGRHASCVVRPAYFGNASTVLVLGGYGRNGREAILHPGLQRLNFLSLSRVDGSEVRWVEHDASGEVPHAIYHHQCCSFSQGKKVLVFGGDTPSEDPAYKLIRNRAQASLVFVLDVDQRQWERVNTSGVPPSWRSFHVGVHQSGLVDSREQFVTFGGSAEHCPAFSGGAGAGMAGYALDLKTFEWRRTPEDSFHPSGRLRFGSERVGHHLLVYGGYSEEGRLPREQRLIALNLMSLEWKCVPVQNKAHSFPDAPGAGLKGGTIVGGVESNLFGMRTVPKLEFLCLSHALLEAERETEEEEAEDDVEESESESESPRALLASVGGSRMVRLTPQLLMALLQRRARGDQAAEDDD